MKCISMSRIVVHVDPGMTAEERMALESAGYGYTEETDLDEFEIWDKEHLFGLDPVIKEAWEGHKLQKQGGNSERRN